MPWMRERSPAVVYILHAGNLYGTERMALATLEGFGDRYPVRLVVAPPPRGNGSVAIEATRAGHSTAVFSSPWALVKALLPLFRRHRSVDVIATGVSHSIVCHVLGRLLRVRVRQLHVAHGGTPDSFNRKSTLNRYPVRVIAVSEFVKSQLVQRGVRADRIGVIDNFLSDRQRQAAPVRPPYSPTAGRPARPVDRSNVKMAIVSRVDGIKRIDLLVASLETHGHTDFQFDVFGVGDLLGEMKQRCAAMPNIRFHGFVDDADKRLAEFDFLLHLCPDEPFGLVVLEAFTAGVVVIVPDSGGAGALVQDGVSGLRFRANDPADLHRVLRAAQALTDADCDRLSGGARTALNLRFSQQAGVRRYLDAIDDAGRLSA